MQDIEIVLENLASQEVTPDHAQQLFLEAFIECDYKYKQTCLLYTSDAADE